MNLVKKKRQKDQTNNYGARSTIVYIAAVMGLVVTSIGIMWSNAVYLNSLLPSADSQENKNILDEGGDILPIAPRSSFDSLNSFFSNYTGKGGWIDVGALPPSKTSELRQIAKDIMGQDRDIQCGHPCVNVSVSGTMNTTTRTIIPDKDELLEYCFWEKDVVSSHALTDFQFEKENWEWVAKSFQRLAISHPDALADASKTNCCERLGFLDIGVNVGDWISPIRLLAPRSVPIYGVEGSPATAAIAAANLHTSSLYTAKDQKSCSRLLPFTMATKSQIPAIHREGGVCFSQVQQSYVRGRIQKFNIGGRHITDTQMNQCQKASDVAGATTLEHAIESLCPSNTIPKVYILKIDIEGFEFKAISSVISSWLAKAPPCYFVMEIMNQYSYIASVETLLAVVGYDAVWRPRQSEYPHNTPPWLTGLTGTQKEVGQIMSVTKRGYTELVFGFSDVDKCIDSLMSAD